MAGTEISKNHPLFVDPGGFQYTHDIALENDRGMYLIITPTNTTKGARQGALAISEVRTTALTATDGNPDCAIKIQVSNKSASPDLWRGRGIDISVRNYGTYTGHTASGIYCTAENSTGADLGGDLIAGEFHSKGNGVTDGNVFACKLYDESQSSTGTHAALYIDCTNDSAFTRGYCIWINSGASSGWTNGITFDGNITNALDFAEEDGTNGATRNTGYTTTGNLDGKIRVDVNGNTLYIPLYDGIT